MKYLFLDDERQPSDVTWMLIGDIGHWAADWHVVRSLQEAICWVQTNGFPDVISFDHDLGMSHYEGNYDDGQTGYDFAKWLVEHDMNTGTMPAEFKFTVHSKNTIGSENIRELLEGYLKHKFR